MEPLRELEAAYAEARRDPGVPSASSRGLLRDYVGRPTPLTLAERLSERLGVPRLPEARRPLPHGRAQDQQRARPGAAREAHGQARASSRRRARASTASPPPPCARCSASSASSTWAARTCARQAPNVSRMRLLGAEVRAVDSGARTLKDAINEAMRDWVTNVRTTHYLLGSVLGAHPYPMMVRDFQARDRRGGARADPGRRRAACPTCWSPAWAAARTRSGSSTRSSTIPVELVGVEAGGRAATPGEHAARFLGESQGAAVGVLHGTRTYLLQDEAGNVLPTHSVSAGLDYPAVGPEHALLHDLGRVRYDSRARRGGARRVPAAGARPRASCPRSSPRTRSPGSRASGTRSLAGPRGREPLAAAATRTSATLRGDGRVSAHRRSLRAAARATARKAFVAFVTAGDPVARAHGGVARDAGGRPASTCSSWACRSPIRWPTGP